MRPALRTVVVAVLVPWLAVAAVCARPHVHESDEHDHPAIAHQHFAPHEARVDPADSTHDGPEVADPDERVVWLDDVALAEAFGSFGVVWSVTSAPQIAVPLLVTPEPVALAAATLPHGPPRTSRSLRAPPSVSSLI